MQHFFTLAIDGGGGNGTNLLSFGDYDVIQINGEKFACYGYRSIITFESSWYISENRGEIVLPCGKLSDAKKGECDIDYMFTIYLESNSGFKKGSKLENYSPTFENIEDWDLVDYVSGSATVTDKKDDKYITIRFDSFKFDNGSNSYTLDGIVQLSLDED